jgi:hypothetical protein
MTNELLATVMRFGRRITRKSMRADVRNDRASESMNVGKRITEVIEKKEQVLMVRTRNGDVAIQIATQNCRTGNRGNKKKGKKYFVVIYAKIEK